MSNQHQRAFRHTFARNGSSVLEFHGGSGGPPGRWFADNGCRATTDCAPIMWHSAMRRVTSAILPVFASRSNSANKSRSVWAPITRQMPRAKLDFFPCTDRWHVGTRRQVGDELCEFIGLGLQPIDPVVERARRVFVNLIKHFARANDVKHQHLRVRKRIQRQSADDRADKHLRECRCAARCDVQAMFHTYTVARSRKIAFGHLPRQPWRCANDRENLQAQARRKPSAKCECL